MFSRDKQTPQPAARASQRRGTGTDAGAGDEQRAAKPGGKGRPTPTRKQAEAAHQRPLVPADRKAAARANREAAREARQREYQAMQTGDERHLPARDRGPVRRWVRDYVDARWNLAEFFLPIAFVFVAVTFLAGQLGIASLILVVLLYGYLLATMADAFILSRIIRRRARARFGADQLPRGILMYAVMRAFQLRRLRLPKPQVKHGQFPS